MKKEENLFIGIITDKNNTIGEPLNSSPMTYQKITTLFKKEKGNKFFNGKIKEDYYKIYKGE